MYRRTCAKPRGTKRLGYDRNDRNAWERSFQLGDQVLFLLPTPTNKLMAQWHGPYPVLRQVGPVTF